MPLDYPRMLFKPEGATCVVPSVAARDEAVAAGWFELADAWFLRGEAPPEPVAEPIPAAPRTSWAKREKRKGVGA